MNATAGMTSGSPRKSPRGGFSSHNQPHHPQHPQHPPHPHHESAQNDHMASQGGYSQHHNYGQPPPPGVNPGSPSRYPQNMQQPPYPHYPAPHHGYMHQGYNNNFPGHNGGYGGHPPHFGYSYHGQPQPPYSNYMQQQHPPSPPNPNMPPQAGPVATNAPYGAVIKSAPSHSSDKKSSAAPRPAGTKPNGEKKSISAPDLSSPSYRAPPSLHSPKEEEDEQDLYSVSPMRSDFHFFAADQKDKCLASAKAVAQKGSTCGNPQALEVFTALNEQIMELWEGQTGVTRSSYMSKEEEDRRRFMQEDEIAGRHCATLTARSKSPRVPIGSASKVTKVVTKDEDDVEVEPKAAHELAPSNKRDASDSADDNSLESPLKKSKLDTKLAESQETSSSSAPSGPPSSEQAPQESPMKVDDERVPEVSPEKKSRDFPPANAEEVDDGGKTVSESDGSDSNITASKAV